MIGSRLRHIVTVQRATEGDRDRDGHATRSIEDVGEPIRAHIAPKEIRELALTNDAGAVLGDHTLWLLPSADVTEADRVTHTAADCPVPAPGDYPDATFEVRAVRNAGGAGHHLEVDVAMTRGLPE